MRNRRPVRLRIPDYALRVGRSERLSAGTPERPYVPKNRNIAVLPIVQKADCFSTDRKKVSSLCRNLGPRRLTFLAKYNLIIS